MPTPSDALLDPPTNHQVVKADEEFVLLAEREYTSSRSLHRRARYVPDKTANRGHGRLPPDKPIHRRPGITQATQAGEMTS